MSFNPSFLRNDENQDSSPLPAYLIERVPNSTQKSGLLERWYRLTAPPTPPADASLAQREKARRGRLASMILLFVIILIIVMFPVVIFNHTLFPIMLGALLASSIALLLNRSGRIMAGGILMVCFVDLGFATGLVMTHGGLGVYNLPTFDLLTIAELLAVSLLPPRSVFFVALANCLFIWFGLSFLPHNAELSQLLATTGYSVIVRPIILQVIVAIVTFLWVRSATQAIARADRAEVIATLEHTIAEQEHAVAQEKRLLDASIAQIVETHMRVANGDFNARVPLTQDNVLWQIAGSLNNLLSRLQRLRQSEETLQKMQPQIYQARQIGFELQRSRQEIAFLVAALQNAKAGRQPIQYKRGSPLLDPVIAELNSNYLVPGYILTQQQSEQQAKGKNR